MHRGKQPWLIIYVPLGTSTLDVYSKISTRLGGDFYTDKVGDHSVMLIIPPDSKRGSSSSSSASSVVGGGGGSSSLAATERAGQQALFQQAYAALADLLGKLRDGVVASFQQRTQQYDADIRRLDGARGTAQFDFWQLFLVKESLALMYQMMQLPDRALGLYEELEALLPFAPLHSLPLSEWPMVIASANPTGDNSGGSGAAGGSNSIRTPTKPSKTPTDNSNNSNSEDVYNSDAGGGSRNNSGNVPTSSAERVAGGEAPLSSPSGSSRSKRDLMSDACRCGEEVIAYSINQARMNILWNRFSMFQLQHYLFARQMYFLLVHLRQPTRCAEKALAYMRACSSNLEQKIAQQQQQSASAAAVAAAVATAGQQLSGGVAITKESGAGGSGTGINTMFDSSFLDRGADDKFFQLRRAQADVWLLMASLKLIRECRALLQLLVGGDAQYNSIFFPASVGGGAAAGGSSGGAANNNASSSTSYSHNSSSNSSSGGAAAAGNALDSFQDNLAAVSSSSTHGGSVVYSSLAELSRSQHGLSHTTSGAHHRKTGSIGGGVGGGGVGGGMGGSTGGVGDMLLPSSMGPAAALRDVLFSPQLDIAAELRDSSRVLGDLVEFALKRLQSLSSSTVRNAGKKAIEIAVSTSPVTTAAVAATAAAPSVVATSTNTTTEGGTAGMVRRTVTKINNATLASGSAAATNLLALNSNSTRNADLVVTIEQELSLLDEAPPDAGAADVGERMDQVRK